MRTPLEMRFCVSLPESGQRPPTSATYRRVGDGTAHRATGGRGRGRSTTGPGREKRDGERGRCGVRGSSDSSAVAKGCCRLRRGSAGFPVTGSPVQRTARGTDRTKQLGQALVEAGLVIALFVIVVLGMIEFGYAFMALNVITQATTVGARAGAALQVGNRGTCGTITDSSAVDGNPNGLVRRQIGGTATVTNVTVTQTPDPNVLCSGICCTFTGSNIPTVTVTVTGNLPYFFGLLGSSSLSS